RRRGGARGRSVVRPAGRNRRRGGRPGRGRRGGARRLHRGPRRLSRGRWDREVAEAVATLDRFVLDLLGAVRTLLHGLAPSGPVRVLRLAHGAAARSPGPVHRADEVARPPRAQIAARARAARPAASATHAAKDAFVNGGGFTMASAAPRLPIPPSTARTDATRRVGRRRRTSQTISPAVPQTAASIDHRSGHPQAPNQPDAWPNRLHGRSVVATRRDS